MTGGCGAVSVYSGLQKISQGVGFLLAPQTHYAKVLSESQCFVQRKYCVYLYLAFTNYSPETMVCLSLHQTENTLIVTTFKLAGEVNNTDNPVAMEILAFM